MKLGYILILDTEAAQPLLEKGSLRFDKYLDPHDPKDGTEIDFFRGNPSGKRHAKPQPAAAPSAPLPPEEEEAEEEIEEAPVEKEQEETPAAPEEPAAAPAAKKTETKKGK